MARLLCAHSPTMAAKDQEKKRGRPPKPNPKYFDGATDADIDAEIGEDIDPRDSVRALQESSVSSQLASSAQGATPDEGMEEKLLLRLQEMLPSILADLGSLKPALSEPVPAKIREKPQGLVSALEKKIAPHHPRTVVKRSMPKGKVEDEDVDDVMEVAPVEDDSYVRAVLDRARKVGSVSLWCNQVQWKQARNRRECQALSEAIDALVEEGLGEGSLGLEMLARRLVGVQLADKTNDWSICEAIQGPSMADSVLPRHMFSKALREAATIRRLNERAGRGTRFKSAGRSFPDRHVQPQDNRRSQGRGGAPRP